MSSAARRRSKAIDISRVPTAYDLPDGRKLFKPEWKHHFGRYLEWVERRRNNAAGNEAHTIGKLFEDHKEYEKAIEWHRADIYHQRQVDDAEKLHLRTEKALKDRGEKFVEHRDEVEAWRRLGECSFELGELDEAAARFQRGLELSQRAGRGLTS